MSEQKKMFLKGFRLLGSRKNSLINGALAKQIKILKDKGINIDSYLKNKYNISDIGDFKKIQTKRISGIISDLVEIGRL